MRYCGNCGESLSPESFDIFAGYDPRRAVCPACGAPISPTDNLEFANTIDVAREATRQPLAALPTSPERGYNDDPRTIATGARRITFRPLALVALIALALLLALGSALLLNNAPGHPRLNLPLFLSGGGSTAQATSAPSTPPNGAQTASSGATQPTAGASPSAGTPTAGTPNAGTATPGVSTTATPSAGQPALAVAPTKVSNLVCLGSVVKLTVTNTGAGAMIWSASGSRAAYTLSPQSGTLDSGQQQTVTVSGISANGQITITAPGAANSPQVVTITCTL